MSRIRTRAVWLLLIMLAAIATVAIGANWFSDAVCKRIVSVILYGSTGLATVWMVIHAISTRDNSILSQLRSIVVVAAIGLILPTLAGPVLSQVPEIKSTFCPNCDVSLAEAERLRKLGGDNLPGAETLARACFDNAPDSEAAAKAARELVLILADRVELKINLLPGRPGKPGEYSTSEQCVSALTVINEAVQLATQYAPDLVSFVQERQRRYLSPTLCGTGVVITIPPPTMTVEILHVLPPRTSNGARVDFQVKKDNQPQSGFKSGAFTLNGETVSASSFSEHTADDPVCIIAVVDNSGSISTKGAADINAALKVLNDNRNRNPKDELGMILFATNVSVIQAPHLGNLPLVPNPKGGTALWDAMLKGLETAQQCRAENRYVIALTDGANTVPPASPGLSGDDLENARKISKIAQDQDISICTIGIQSDDFTADAEKALQVAVNGCEYQRADNTDKVYLLFQNITGFVHNFYRIEIPKDALSSGSNIEVCLQGQPKQNCGVAVLP